MKGLRMKILIFFIGLLLVWLILSLLPKPQVIDGNNPFSAQQNRPHIIAHGGGNMEFPDNTLEAYYHAFSIDENVILETDVNLTSDGVVVLSHDRTFDRKTTLVNAHVHEISYQYLIDEAIDFGYENPIDGPNGFNTEAIFIKYENYQGNQVTPQDVIYPEGIEPRHAYKFLATSLEDLIVHFPDNLIIVELKQFGEQGDALFDAVITLMDELDDDYNTYERIILASFHEQIYERFKTLQSSTHPQLLYSPQESSLTRFFVLHVLRLTVFFRDKPTAFQVPMAHGSINLATQAFVNAARRHNIATHYWTINDEEDMRTLIELGVDGIMTDRPTLLKTLLDAYYPPN